MNLLQLELLYNSLSAKRKLFVSKMSEILLAENTKVPNFFFLSKSTEWLWTAYFSFKSAKQSAHSSTSPNVDRILIRLWVYSGFSVFLQLWAINRCHATSHFQQSLYAKNNVISKYVYTLKTTEVYLILNMRYIKFYYIKAFVKVNKALYRFRQALRNPGVWGSNNF